MGFTCLSLGVSESSKNCSSAEVKWTRAEFSGGYFRGVSQVGEGGGGMYKTVAQPGNQPLLILLPGEGRHGRQGKH